MMKRKLQDKEKSWFEFVIKDQDDHEELATKIYSRGSIHFCRTLPLILSQSQNVSSPDIALPKIWMVTS